MADRTLLFVGTYTRPAPYLATTNGQGISVYSLNRATGKLTPVSETQGIDNPSYLAIDPTQRYLYATSEVWGWNEGTISAYAIDSAAGTLSYINKQAALGSINAHIVVEPSNRYLLLANFWEGKGVVMFPIRADGGLDPACSADEPVGSGPHPGQNKSHCHCILPDPDNRYAFVTDLGSDMVWSYKLDLEAGKLIPNEAGNLRLQAGSGPRHFLFHPGGKFAYVIQEFSSSVTAMAYADGKMQPLQTISTLPDGYSGDSHCSAIRVSTDGRFLYGANRGHGSIAVFAIDPQTGRLTSVEITSTKGRTPREFNLDPSGNFLLAANQDSDTIVTFRIDRASGRLQDTGLVASVPTPVCLKMIEV